jgi:ABC-type dipeptide/oligopeptide/nickel transport system ATPase component
MQINQFDLKHFIPNPSIIVIGKRGCGKSYLALDIISNFIKNNTANKNNVLVISSNSDHEYIYGRKLVSYTPELIDNILKLQKNKIENKHKNSDVDLLVVFDDCFNSKGSWMKDQAITELLFNNRHYHITYVLMMQYPLGITPELRSNFDYLFLFKDNFISNVKRMYDHYAGMFPSFDIFRQVLLEVTNDYGVMVINNRSNDSCIDQTIYWYRTNYDQLKAENVPEILLQSTFNLNNDKSDSISVISDDNISDISDDKIDNITSDKIDNITNNINQMHIYDCIIKCNSSIVNLISNNQSSDQLVTLCKSILDCNKLICESIAYPK